MDFNSERDYSLVVLRPREPLNTTQRMLLAVPPDADLEPGFNDGVRLLKRLARQLSVPMLVITEGRGSERLFKRMKALNPDCDLKLGKTEQWSAVTRSIAEQYRAGDLIGLMGERQGGLAWKHTATRLPDELAERFPSANLVLLYAGERIAEAPDSMVNPEPGTRKVRLRPA